MEFCWIRASTHHMLFPVLCPRNNHWNEKAPCQHTEVVLQRREHTRVRLSFSQRSPSVVRLVQEKWSRSCTLQTAGAKLLSEAADLAWGVESGRLRWCRLMWLSSWFVWVDYLMTLSNPSQVSLYGVLFSAQLWGFTVDYTKNKGLSPSTF